MISVSVEVFIQEQYNEDGELGRQVITLSLFNQDGRIMSRDVVFFAVGSNPNYLGQEALKEAIAAHKRDLINEYNFLFLGNE
jgi:hypothetical protein